MAVDRNFLTREFKRYIWPVCRVYGFSKIKGRTIWRFRDGAIDVVNLQGDGWNRSGTPQGFFINLGVYLSGIERSWVRKERGLAVPAEADCDMRGRLRRSAPGARSTDWSIAVDGADVEDVMGALQVAVQEQALPWFRQFWEPSEILKYLLETESENEFGLGGLGSPLRNLRIGLFALSLGRVDLAESYLRAYETYAIKIEGGLRGEIGDLVMAGLARARP